MNREVELGIVRRAYAKQIMAAAMVGDARVEAAFAAVRREAYLGPGPWPVLRTQPDGYVPTPSDDPVYLYVNQVVGLLTERNLNNGEPSLHAMMIESAAPKPGEHAVHIGPGVGYYTAILAELVGANGRITAIELDAGLADRAAANLAGLRHVRVLHGNGALIPFDPADVIYVNAGATRPAEVWLDRLNENGRLILPLTASGFPNTDFRKGAVFRITRQGQDFLAKRISAVGIFPCEGMRDPASEAALAAAFERGRIEEVARLYRRDDVLDEDCWVRGKGWCLAYH
jgi:protein-L-isoaspartate(D-aspartate) O-methyltransferase